MQPTEDGAAAGKDSVLPLFYRALGLGPGQVVCLVGAGGKTSLLYRLAREARALGLRVLVSTTTRIARPADETYDGLDLSGALFAGRELSRPGIYLGGSAAARGSKIRGVGPELLSREQPRFDLVLLEADGAARKPLKGWKASEPVIPALTSRTIGVVDIQTIGAVITQQLVHRLELFLELTRAKVGEPVRLEHLCRLITHERGLFQYARGQRCLLLNKVESGPDRCHADALAGRLGQLARLQVVAGSVQQGVCHGCHAC
ncbi:selenium cofactor biosynthesis protein YqeC [Desulfogranum mediterraneum]|uniref:selenium cofactor biosynthesis protein YqeC n=1 Tax=Desulfogranum mediterraneum TaxID=160661 RepID=UPI000688DD7C|nr:selenium cofactor biosynthesis protein YqeC [Desulfogranum mediterraneum]